MRKIICLLAVALLVTACEKKEKHRVYRNGRIVEIEGPLPQPPKRVQHKRILPADGKYPVMTFTETKFDFGDIRQGDKVTHVFKFTNTGEADLLISDAYGSCGCTKPKFPKEAIKAGETGAIEVTFNSSGRNGMQHKTVTMITNTKAEKEQVQIQANINLGAE